jgi:hypothetical protein
MTRSEIEDAVRTWLKTATGMADGAVIIADQDGPSPTTDYLSVRIGETPPVARQAEQQTSTDLGQPAGQEVQLTAVVDRYATVTVSAYTSKTTGGSSNAVDLLEKAANAISLPSIRQTLNDAGLGVVEVGSVKNLSAVARSNFEGVAALDVRFSLRQTVSERTGYISKVVTVDNTGTPGMQI